jgi:hypothetical protein
MIAPLSKEKNIFSQNKKMTALLVKKLTENLFEILFSAEYKADFTLWFGMRCA